MRIIQSLIYFIYLFALLVVNILKITLGTSLVIIVYMWDMCVLAMPKYPTHIQYYVQDTRYIKYAKQKYNARNGRITAKYPA